ncbi:MAG: acetylornithine transaminase [Nitrospirae bacterium]|nr:MAG: acetylornithine transaminase [Nitrospirota bacterium]
MKRLMEEAQQYLMNTYQRYPLVIFKGRASTVITIDGKEYLDLIAGIAVNVLGHCHPRVVLAIQKQAQRLIHVSNLFYNEPQIKLAKLLVENSFAHKVFFCNSGAEANEGAIKLARAYARAKGYEDRYEIITAYNSFHGRTMATLTATGQEKYQKGFEPLLPGFKYVPYNDIEAVKEAITDKTCAVMIEPIQGEGGIIVPDREYIQALRQMCTEAGVLLIFDEVQTGIGRTGHLFAYEHFGVEPDIMTLAKGLGGGFPIGALLAKDEVAEAFVPGSHASTFGGNPLACAAALSTLETVLEDGIILEECRQKGQYMKGALLKLKEKYSGIVEDVRGLGLMLGMSLKRDPEPVINGLLQKGIIAGKAGTNTLRFTPALTIEYDEIDRAMDALNDVIGRLS